MTTTRQTWLRLLSALILLLPLGACANPDALWQIVHEQCVPNQRQHGQPAPCAEVTLAPDEAHGHVVLKDRNGPLQYLLMPTAKISGIESAQLLAADTPNFFAEAWRARGYMARKLGQPIDRSAIALTVNSPGGRSQNQLHIHISCINPAVRNRLAALQTQIGPRWQPLPGGLNGHAYQARRVTGADLDGIDPIKDLAASLPGARAAMGDYTLAVVATRFADGNDGFYLLADKADLLSGDVASAEGDIQDHDCAVLKQP
ncbi:CDP-diacylglycerol diphosphatase [Paludibacterium sp.]|uniref:CDP-diacylglycerol diphosphatase n=1 Tax=Paludibacterium sp. TaxID=1917523 RepID=UPI0025D943EC|nr:CDP-diacylglycerol diphosphatase [Paludibacterium sp.]MBV8649076.1 CDP-diacylglycerol diphosphatase [Paludibacterium sp.]